jgi:site-specific DNA recombinase
VNDIQNDYDINASTEASSGAGRRHVRAVLYARVSTEEQRERESIQTQLEFGRRYAATHGITITEEYADEGVSGTVPLKMRLQGRRLLEDLQKRQVDVVLTFRLDRLGRETLLILETVNQIEASGAQIRSMTEPFTTESASGKLLLTLLSGFAGYERDAIIERSLAGTERLARKGVWLGGIVPFGYEVVGKDKEARIQPNHQLIPNQSINEVDVVRMIYRLAAEEGQSCMKIADRLNALKVPTVYARDGRKVERGKRLQATSGKWRPSRIRGLLTNTTYKGIHQYGKRSKRTVIERDVPALVDSKTWEAAQETLRKNRLDAPRNSKRKYLLRGLIRCAHCGQTYGGSFHNKSQRGYYRCNGHQSARLGHRERCPSVSIPVKQLEEDVWEDIDRFLRNPGDVIEQLQASIDREGVHREHTMRDISGLQTAFAEKQRERQRILELYRRAVITEDDLKAQLEAITAEQAILEHEIENCQDNLRKRQSEQEMLHSTEQLLIEVRARLDAPLSWAIKRAVVEQLVEGISARTEGKEASVDVTYRFVPVENRTDRGCGWQRAGTWPGR